MVGYVPDHAGLETIPLDDCLGLLASVPLGRVGFLCDGEVVMLPVNHAVSGQDVVFRTTLGSKLSAAESENAVTFEADHYDPRRRAGWSVLVTGRAEMVYDDDEIAALDRLGLEPWPDAVDRSFWVRIRPRAVTGRRLPPGVRTAAADSPGGELRVVNVLSGEAAAVRQTPFGDVGTVFSSADLEVVWVSKLGEPVDEHWFSSHDPDVILVVQGQLKFEFENPAEADRVLGVGDVLTLPAETRCRAYSWPRHASQAAVFVAAGARGSAEKP
jgi:nitroimidazol reductase NimA-like FMN-containing flavoprotein (pyridoxamine 5'-phosphate oxidase superfamily)